MRTTQENAKAQDNRERLVQRGCTPRADQSDSDSLTRR